MAKLVDSKDNEINKDIVLWTGNTFAEMTIDINYDVYSFKELIVILNTNSSAIIPIVENQTEITCSIGNMAGNFIICGFVRLKINSSKNLYLQNLYIAHQFNGSHPDQSAQKFVKIIGRY